MLLLLMIMIMIFYIMGVSIYTRLNSHLVIFGLYLFLNFDFLQCFSSIICLNNLVRINQCDILKNVLDRGYLHTFDFPGCDTWTILNFKFRLLQCVSSITYLNNLVSVNQYDILKNILYRGLCLLTVRRP